MLPGAGMVCMHSGQGCAITTRLLLPRSRYDEGVEIVKAAFESFPYGDPTDFNNMAGPLINARQRERVLGYIEKGKAEGAKCIVGGGPATQFDKGYFVQPTLFVDVDPDSTIAQEEIFGPVLVGDPVRGRRRRGAHREQLALRLVGRGQRRRRSTARSASPAASAPARSSVNGGQWFGPDSPFGGYKESGQGREHGVAGFEEYLETKTDRPARRTRLEPA